MYKALYHILSRIEKQMQPRLYSLQAQTQEGRQTHLQRIRERQTGSSRESAVNNWWWLLGVFLLRYDIYVCSIYNVCQEKGHQR